MHAEDFLVHNRGYRQTIKAVGEGFPQFYVISSLAWIHKLKEGVTDEEMLGSSIDFLLLT